MRHTQRAALAALALLAALSAAAVAGCGGGVGASPTPRISGAVDVTGVITSLTHADGAGRVSMLVVADTAAPGAVDRAMAQVTADTLIWARDGVEWRRLSAAALVVGRRVAVRFSGPVAESYPVQAIAGDVEVLSSPSGN